ncbi:branched-chain amino acid ABC transporter substrate-binding protein [Chelatococcus reniformis]|uniref:Branched-chain amino acid ABC transporter substrate-binding protein n=2 Tax=Chelatococcus reniformis TaxID=1494448 RepID=A0A916ULD3_9HYPH|nr:branched-chain amino acid ABC transporter substrate-binding protein [Chelatococcus reniformis]
MAVADFGGKVNGKPIEIVFADHQLKPDVAISILRKWYDVGGVDAVVDLTTSAIALAARDISLERNKVVLNTGAATTALYREQCSPNSVMWSMDNYIFGHDIPKQVLLKGRKKWFLIVTDYAFGHGLQALITETVQANGATVVGAVRHPLAASDYSSFLLRAQSSGADVLAFANSQGDLAQSLKQAREFGLDKSMQLVAPANGFHTVLSLGLDLAQGMLVAEPSYWDLNDETRAFARRFRETTKKPPTGGQVLAYSAITHYLKAVSAVGGPVDGKAVVRRMKEVPVSDFAMKGTVREDGRFLYDVLVTTVKKPSQSSDPFDVYNITGSIPAADAFAPLAGSPCPLVK